LGCTCIIPMLECVQSPSKFIETHDAFSCDFIVVVKSCERGFYHSIGMNEPSILGIMTLVNFLTLWTIGWWCFTSCLGYWTNFRDWTCNILVFWDNLHVVHALHINILFELGFKGGLNGGCVRGFKKLTMLFMTSLKNWSKGFLCKKWWMPLTLFTLIMVSTRSWTHLLCMIGHLEGALLSWEEHWSQPNFYSSLSWWGSVGWIYFLPQDDYEVQCCCSNETTHKL